MRIWPAALRRIEERLGTLPDEAPTEHDKQWNLPEIDDVYAGRHP